MSDMLVLIIEPPSLSQQIRRAARVAEEGRGIQVIGVAATAPEAMALMAAAPPDVLIIDLAENPAGGLQTLRAIRQQNNRVMILARADGADEDFILRAIQTGVMGFITGQEDLSAALHTLRQGEPYLPPLVAGQLVRGLQRAG